tara:strand:- start:275 stop:1000 length:726 start_codon:yes stop_codon:yes gene_type:complete
MTEETKKPKRRRRRSKYKTKKNHYFTQVHEDAIIEYVATDDRDRRNVLYRDFIGPAFSEMVEKITFTYKFTSLNNVDVLKEECIIWLTTILDKYDPSKGSKAFSYFSVITKNWFIQKTKKQSKQLKKEVPLDDITKDGDFEAIACHNEYDSWREQWEFWTSLRSEVDSWEHPDMKPNERKVLKAVQILLDSPDDIPIFNKKAIYLYLRELTGLNTKQIVNYLNKMRERYRKFKYRWNEEGA